MKLFCPSNGLSAAVKMAAVSAGVLIAANNKEKITGIIPVAQEIINKITGGSEALAMNALVKQGIVKLVQMFSEDKKFQAEAAIVLSVLNINIADNSIPNLSNESLKDLVNSFITGMQTGINL